jgi:hypothetical protein
VKCEWQIMFSYRFSRTIPLHFKLKLS